MGHTLSTGLILLVFIFALLGAIANAMLAWLNQKPRPPFDGGSFAASFIVSVAAAVGIAEVFNYAGVTNTTLACFGAFLSGMGGNGVVGGIAGAIVQKQVPATVPAAVKSRPQFILGYFYRRV